MIRPLLLLLALASRALCIISSVKSSQYAGRWFPGAAWTQTGTQSEVKGKIECAALCQMSETTAATTEGETDDSCCNSWQYDAETGECQLGLVSPDKAGQGDTKIFYKEDTTCSLNTWAPVYGTKLLVISSKMTAGVIFDLVWDSICKTLGTYPYFPRNQPVGAILDATGTPVVCTGESGAVCHQLNLANESWSESNHILPDARIFTAATSYGVDQWWITGGTTIGNLALNSTILYTPGQGFALHEPLPLNLAFHCLLRLDQDHFFLTAGTSHINDAVRADGHTFIFNSADKQFVEQEKTPQGSRKGPACGLVERPSGERDVVVAGGMVNGPTYDTYIFSLDRHVWSQGEDLPVAKMWRLESVQLAKTFLAVGGFSVARNSDLDTIYKFVPGQNGPEGDRWNQEPIRLPMKASYLTAMLLPVDTPLCG